MNSLVDLVIPTAAGLPFLAANLVVPATAGLSLLAANLVVAAATGLPGDDGHRLYRNISPPLNVKGGDGTACLSVEYVGQPRSWWPKWRRGQQRASS